MARGTLWFLWNAKQETLADFAAYKPHMMAGFALIGLGVCIFVQDFLAVRGLAIVLLLLGKLMVDTGRPHLGETPWVLVIQTWAYVLIIAGMWFTVSPWRLRDLLNWATSSEERIRVGSAVRLAFALSVVLLIDGFPRDVSDQTRFSSSAAARSGISFSRCHYGCAGNSSQAHLEVLGYPHIVQLALAGGLVDRAPD
jgi:hypothetical protein